MHNKLGDKVHDWLQHWLQCFCSLIGSKASWCAFEGTTNCKNLLRRRFFFVIACKVAYIEAEFQGSTNNKTKMLFFPRCIENALWLNHASIQIHLQSSSHSKRPRQQSPTMEIFVEFTSHMNSHVREPHEEIPAWHDMRESLPAVLSLFKKKHRWNHLEKNVACNASCIIVFNSASGINTPSS